jgi:DNA-binding transcriptional LysR family regulator
MDTQALLSLIAAVETGSLSAAARRLGVTQPAVSQKLASLETDFGQQLLVRSRQGVRPTAAGQLAFEHGARVLAAIAQMRAVLDAFKGDVAGNLRVSASMLLSQTVMGPVIAGLRQSHPRLKIDMMAGQPTPDFDPENFDLALLISPPVGGAGTLRKIGEFECLLVSTPGYLEAVGRPNGPDELRRLAYIQCEGPEIAEIELRHPAGLIRAQVTPAFLAQYPELALHAVISGMGFATAARFYVQNQLRTGEFEVVLPGYAAVAKPLFLWQAEHVKDLPRARAFVELLEETLKGIDGFTPAPRIAGHPPRALPIQNVGTAALLNVLAGGVGQKADTSTADTQRGIAEPSTVSASSL